MIRIRSCGVILVAIYLSTASLMSMYVWDAYPELSEDPDWMMLGFDKDLVTASGDAAESDDRRQRRLGSSLRGPPSPYHARRVLSEVTGRRRQHRRHRHLKRKQDAGQRYPADRAGSGGVRFLFADKPLRHSKYSGFSSHIRHSLELIDQIDLDLDE